VTEGSSDLKPSRTPDAAGFREDLAEAAARLEGPLAGEVKVSVHDIPTGLAASVKGDRPGWAASVIKLPVLVAAAREIEEGRLSLDEPLLIDHRFLLDPADSVSRLPAGSRLPVRDLLDLMIAASDNEATNVLADRVGIDRVNAVSWGLGLSRTMLGHLLCRGVPRHASHFNPDGSNLTCPDDMTALLRHIYDPSFSHLSPGERVLADRVLSRTHAAFLRSGPFRESRVKAKIGFIADAKDGSDIHEVGIIDDRLIVSVMLNRVGQKRPQEIGAADAFAAILEVVGR
jgi:beta-lactamase class A